MIDKVTQPNDLVSEAVAEALQPLVDHGISAFITEEHEDHLQTPTQHTEPTTPSQALRPSSLHQLIAHIQEQQEREIPRMVWDPEINSVQGRSS